MKVIIAGSRHIEDYDILKELIESTGWDIDEVVSGGCRGVDEMGERWARENDIPVRGFAADWARYGREAGELRNREMANYADGLILLWDAKSPGASCMMRESARADIPIRHHVYGLNLADIGQAEQAVMGYYWSGKGRLVHRHSHWEWEVANADAPEVCEEIVTSLVEQGLLEEATLRVLHAPHTKQHSTLA